MQTIESPFVPKRQHGRERDHSQEIATELKGLMLVQRHSMQTKRKHVT